MAEQVTTRAKRLTRGAVSKLTGCNIETVRFYERIGLLPKPERSEGGHRLYSSDHVARLHFIHRCRALGFAIGEIRVLLDLVDRRDYTCGEVRDIAVAHVEEIRGKIKDLRRLEKTMLGMIRECEGGAVPDCPVIEALFDPGAAPRG